MVYWLVSVKERPWYETKGNSSEIDLPNARPFFTSEGAMIPQARTAPPMKLQEAFKPESIPAPKKAGVTIPKRLAKV